MARVERFDIEKVTQICQNSLHNEDDVLLEHYLQAYEEINKFLQLLGTVFGFVSSDVRAKLDILYGLREQEGGKTNFHSVRVMIEYEKNGELLNQPNYVSGSRTLLRLHRGLEFVYEFLMGLIALQDADKVTTCCKNAYRDTLAKHHPWLIRKGALMSMYALPTQGELLKRVCLNVPRALELFPEMLQATRIIYDRTHQLYEHYSLHDLP